MLAIKNGTHKILNVEILLAKFIRRYPYCFQHVSRPGLATCFGLATCLFAICFKTRTRYLSSLILCGGQ